MARLLSFALVLLVAFTLFKNAICQDGSSTSTSTTITKKRKFESEDMIKLEDLAGIRMNLAWNLTNAIYEAGKTNITAAHMDEYTLGMIAVFKDIHETLKIFERKVIAMQPNKLMNRLINLQEMESLQNFSDTKTEDPIIQWRVKWIEVSSLATHIHWLYNKRIRDILTSVPYIKTIASSLNVYFGNPWYSVLSGRKDKQRRHPMRNFGMMIDQRLFSVREGDLFQGIATMLNDSSFGKSGSATATDTCTGQDLLGRINPVRLDSPLYVLIYLCLVDFKNYLLENYHRMYLEAFEGYPLFKFSSSDERLRQRVRRKVDAYNSAFRHSKRDYSGRKVMPGYFRCDPPSIDPQSNIRNHKKLDSFIRITNFLTGFVAPEESFSPSHNCDGTCQNLGHARTFCQANDTKCLSKVHPECDKKAALCKTKDENGDKWKPPCPLSDLYCMKGGMSSTSCSSGEEDKLYQYITLDDKTYGKKTDEVCPSLSAPQDGSVIKSKTTRKEVKCEICFCQCFEPIKIKGGYSSVRLFSLLEVVSRVGENRVVAGLKFEQVGTQIHFVIADAVSIPGYKIDRSTMSWHKPEVADESKPENVIRLSKNRRSFLLDDFKVEEGFVLTGIKFVDKLKKLDKPDMEEQFYVAVQVQATRVDPTTGDLDASTSIWLENPNVGLPSNYPHDNPGDPLIGDGAALPDSSINQLIDFRSTSWNKDASQVTIPFFDSQQMYLNAEVSYALRGVGVFHKTVPGHGGFLGIKILPYGDVGI